VKAQTFYTLGWLLGLSAAQLDAMLTEGTLPQIEDRGNGMSLVIIPGLPTNQTLIKTKLVNRWAREFDRLRNEDPR
jgi:hypothetical protein